MNSKDVSDASSAGAEGIAGTLLLAAVVMAASWGLRQDEIEKHLGLLEQARQNGSLNIDIDTPVLKGRQTIGEVLEALKSSRVPIIIASFSGSDRNGVHFRKDLRIPREKVISSLEQMDDYYGNVRIMDRKGNVLEPENSIALNKFVQDLCCRERPSPWTVKVTERYAPELSNRR